jgi:galactokinase
MERINPTQLARRFAEIFGRQPKIFRAPGRVNLIGEHTDYNDGFVMPCAIDFAAHVAISSRPDQKLLLRSQNFPEQFEFHAGNLPTQRLGTWSDYVIGVAVALQQMGRSMQGANVLVAGDVPIGSGLSSSAAVEVASTLAFISLNGASLPMPDIARLCQSAENSYVGARVGIMDQFVSCLGKAGHALMLDCRSLDCKLIPIPKSVRLVICNTMVKHEHASGEYNRRREECEQGLKHFARLSPGVRALRDVSAVQLETHRDGFPSVVYQRCLHVLQENQRVLKSAECLERGNLRRFGELMGESHRSLRDLYQVSCRELDAMVEIAEGLEGFYGGRMTGGGFGGCTVNLVNADDVERFGQEIAERYQRTTGIEPEVYVCSAADGAGVELS